MGIKLKRSAVAGKVPLTTDIDLGELAVNTTDGKLYLKKSVSGTESVVEVGGLPSGDLPVEDKIVHAGDTNTAIRFPAADTVTVETNGLERLRVASDGWVGIGNNNPDALLHLYSAASYSEVFLNNDREAYYTARVIGGTSQRFYVGSDDGGGGRHYVWGDGAYPVVFLTDNTERARIEATGNFVFNHGIRERVFAITDGTTVNLDPTNGSIQTWTLGANRTPGQANWAEGQSITLLIDDGAARTITWTTLGVVWVTDGGTAPTLATSGFTVIVLWKVGTTIYGAKVGGA